MARDAKDSGTRHSATSIQVEERLDARHIDYRFEANFAIDCIVEAEGHQVRLTERRAPSEMVARYAQQMKAGAVFPAIVVNDRDELIDGNTRRRAAVKAGRSTIPAYICHSLTPLQARALSVELNQTNGLPMEESELHAYVRSAMHEGHAFDTKMCTRITGVKPTTLERWKAQAQFEIRARKGGIRDVDIAALSDSVQAALNGIRLVPVLIDASVLAVAARMSASAVRQMVRQINAAKWEADALAVVAAERAARAEDIRSIASGFVTRRKTSQRSAMHVAALLRLGVDELLEVAPDSRVQTVARLRELRDHASRAITVALTRWGIGENVPEAPAHSGERELCVQGADDA